MGILTSETSRCVLGVRHLVGRRSLAHLRLQSPTVSAEHASLYFTAGTWKLRDLGSKNGTYLNGVRLPLQRSVQINQGDELRFGGSDEPAWLLEDDSAPAPTAVGPNRERVRGNPCNLWVPNAEEPALHVYWSDEGWMLDTPLGSRPTGDGAQVLVGGEQWTLELPPTIDEDQTDNYLTTVDSQAEFAVRLVFAVSLDEEHVSLEAHLGERRVSLGARAHNYPLLVLARRRIEDASRGIADAESGWIYAKDFREQLCLDRGPLNLQLWRASQCLTKAGLPGNRLIERRDDSRQLRIGLESSIEP